MTRFGHQIWPSIAVVATVVVAVATAQPAQEVDIHGLSLLQTSTQLAQQAHAHGDRTMTPYSRGASAAIIAVALFLVLCTLLLPVYIMAGSFGQTPNIELFGKDVDLQNALTLMRSEDAFASTCDSKEYEPAKLRTSLFDTYAISSGLVCSVAATTFFIDNRNTESIMNDEDVTVRYTLRALHQLVVAVSTSCGLYAFLVFVLCAMYSRAALCRPVGGMWLYFHVLEVTKTVRKWAFSAMYASSILCMLALFFHAVSNNVWTSRYLLPRQALDYISVVIGFLILAIFLTLIFQSQSIVKRVTIIFLPDAEVKLIHSSLTSDSSSRGKPTS